MFAKITPDQLKKRATLKTSLLTKLKTTAERYMPKFSSIEDVVFPKKSPVIVYKMENHVELYACDDVPVMVELGSGEVIPHLRFAIEYPGLLPCVYVDEGAVKALFRGADLKAPGIKGRPIPFDNGAVVEVRLLGTQVPFAIGVSCVSSTDLDSHPNGDAVNIVHILRDALWQHRNGL